MGYPMYFLPTRVIEEYKSKIGGEDLTTPILKRRISAMIYATMENRVEVKANVFCHRFDKVEIYVEEDTKIVSKVNYILPRKVEDKIGYKYGKICEFYGLNNSRKDFKNS